jgi:hypothetical protein
MAAVHQCTRRVDDGDARWLQTLGCQDELGVDERCNARGRNGWRQEAQRLLGCRGGDGDRIDDGGGLGRCLVRSYARRRRVGLVWLKREESPHTAHQLQWMAALLKGGDDQQRKTTWQRGSWVATEG